MAVADGMGGHLGGGTAAAMAVDALRAVGNATDPTALLGALKDANRAIARAASDDPGLAGMGTTATAALLEGGILYLVHVGDSRAWWPSWCAAGPSPRSRPTATPRGT